MPSFGLNRFAGLRPRVSPKLLPDEYAQVAHQVHLVDGTLRPRRKHLRVSTEANRRTLVRMPDVQDTCGELLMLDYCASVVEFPAPGSIPDLDHFVVFSRNAPPQRYLPAQDMWAPVIVPQPMTSLTPTKTTTTALDTRLYPNGPDMRTWTYTWVDKFGVESKPAPPSPIVRSWVDEEWELSGFDVPPANAEYVRIYRAMPSYTDGRAMNVPFDATFQLLMELPVSLLGASVVDDRKAIEMEMGTLLTAHDQPPPEGMQQVVGTEQGYLVGFKGNDLFVSERHEAHNWPHQYRMNLPDRIVALVSYGDVVYVLTTARPYRLFVTVAAGRDDRLDAKLDIRRIEAPYPAVGMDACCWAPWGALYASRDGLVALTQDRATLLTPQRIGIDDWMEWCPNQVRWMRGQAFCLRSPAGRGFLLDLPEEGSDLVPGDLVTFDLPGVTAVESGMNGLLYFSDADGTWLFEGAAATQPCLWRSKIWRMPRLMRFSAVQVDVQGQVKVRLFVDGRLEYEHVFSEKYRSRRLPQMRRGVEFEVEIEADEPFVLHGFRFATSRTELLWA